MPAAPGAVTAAQALPPDCGRPPPVLAFSANSADIVVGCGATVMAAPTRVSQNDHTDCFTDTSEPPFALRLFDQETSLPPSPAFAPRLAAGRSASVKAS